MGEFWEKQTGLPLPLGGIVVKRGLSFEIQKKVERVLRRSVEYAFENKESSSELVKCYAQEMEIDVINAHIALYVNNYSISLGKERRSAVEFLFEKASIKTDALFL